MRDMRLLVIVQCCVSPSLATPDHAALARKRVRIEMSFFTTLPHSKSDLDTR